MFEKSPGFHWGSIFYIKKSMRGWGSKKRHFSIWNDQKGRKPLIKGKKANAFWSNPIALIPNLGRTKKTTAASISPSNRIGRRFGLFGLLSPSITSPSITLSSRLVANSLEMNSPTAIASTNIIINRSMKFITTRNQKVKVDLMRKINGINPFRASAITSQRGMKIKNW